MENYYYEVETATRFIKVKTTSDKFTRVHSTFDSGEVSLFLNENIECVHKISEAAFYDVRRVKAACGQTLILDESFYEKHMDHKWYYNRIHSEKIAIMKDSTDKNFQVHRKVLGINKGKGRVSFINGNNTDLRQANLRYTYSVKEN